MNKLIILLFLTVGFQSKIICQAFEKYDSYDNWVVDNIKSDDTLYVVNFWATWCGPCVRELPYFSELVDDYKNQNVSVIMVSLDFARQINSHFIPFLNKNKPKGRITLLMDNNYNNWIEKVDPEWSGVIPGTLLIKGNSKKFLEHEFENYQELKSYVASFHNQKQ